MAIQCLGMLFYHVNAWYINIKMHACTIEVRKEEKRGKIQRKLNENSKNSNFIQTLDSELLETKEKTFTVNAADNEYIYFAIPVSYGEAIAYVGGFEGGFEIPQQITVTNEYNSTDYYLYRSTNPKLGNTTVVVS